MDIATLGLRVENGQAVSSVNQFGASLDQLASKSSETLEHLKTSLLGVAAAAGIGILGHKFFEETIKSQDALAQLEAAVKATGTASGRTAQQLDEMSRSLQDITIFSHDAIKGAETMLLTFNKINGDTFDRATRAATELASRTGGDVADAAHLLGKALQDPEKGLTMLQRQFRLFTDAEVQAISAMDNMGESAKAQEAVLAKVESRFGGAAVAARSTLGGALKGLGNDFGDLFQLTIQQTGGIVGFINTLGDGVKSVHLFGTEIKTLAEVLGGLGLAGVITALIPKVTALASTFGLVLTGAFGAAEVAGTGFAGVLYGLTPLLAPVLAGFGAIALLATAAGLAIYDLNKIFEEHDDKLEEASKNTKEYVDYLKALGHAHSMAGGAGQLDQAKIQSAPATLLTKDAIKLNNELAASLVAVGREQDALNHGGLVAYNNMKQRNSVLTEGAKMWDVEKEGLKGTSAYALTFAQALDKGIPLAKDINGRVGELVTTQGRLEAAVQATTDAFNENAAKQTHLIELSIQTSDTIMKEVGIRTGLIQTHTQELALIGLEGYARERLIIDQKAQNDEFQAMLNLSPSEARERVKAIQLQHDQSIATLNLTTRVGDQKAMTDLINGSLSVANTEGARNISVTKEQTKATAEQITALQHLETTLSRELVTGIGDIATKGLTSWSGFFQQFEKMADHMAKAIEDSLDKLSDGAKSAMQKLASTLGLAGAGVNGGIIGFQLGQATGNSVLGVLGGAAGGAAAGSALGVPGAIVGGLAGAVGGLLGAADAHKQAAAALQQAAEQFKTSTISFIAAGSANSVANQIAGIQQSFKSLADAYLELVKQGGLSHADSISIGQGLVTSRDAQLAKVASDFWDGITKSLNALNGPQGSYLNQLHDIETQYAANINSAVALHASQDQLAQIEALRTKQIEALNEAMESTATSDLMNRLFAVTGGSDLGISSAPSALANDPNKPWFDLFQKYVEGQEQAKRINEAQLAIDQANKDLLAAQLQTAQQSLSITQSNVDSLRNVVTQLADFKSTLKLNTSLTTLSAKGQLDEATRQFKDLLTKAMGGDATAAAGLPGAANTLLGIGKNYYGSTQGYAKLFGDVNAGVGAVQDQFGAQLDTQQAILAELQKQTDVMNAQLGSQQKAAGLAEIQALQAKVTAEKAAGGLNEFNQPSWQGDERLLQLAYGAGSVSAAQKGLQDQYAAIAHNRLTGEGMLLGSNPTTQELNRQAGWYWNPATQSWDNDNPDAPQYEHGGDFSGGWRMVGERGPELELTGPSRILNAQQIAMGAGDVIGELQKIRGELTALVLAQQDQSRTIRQTSAAAGR